MIRAAILIAALVPVTAHANCDPLVMLQSENLGGDRPGSCQVSRTLDGPQTTCHWSFSFRSADATDLASRITQRLEYCGAVLTAHDDSVNHPDSFGQMQFKMAGQVVSVSVKDKTALSRTLVFMSVVTPR